MVTSRRVVRNMSVVSFCVAQKFSFSLFRFEKEIEHAVLVNGSEANHGRTCCRDWIDNPQFTAEKNGDVGRPHIWLERCTVHVW